LQITGNNHTKARLSKKWQNINYNKKQKSSKIVEESIAEPIFNQDSEIADDIGISEARGLTTAVECPESVWAAGQV